MMHRRGLITGLISVVAAPAIVRASSLMPVRFVPIFDELYAPFEFSGFYSIFPWKDGDYLDGMAVQVMQTLFYGTGHGIRS